jgi:hypothetical protein
VTCGIVLTRVDAAKPQAVAHEAKSTPNFECESCMPVSP